MKLFLDANILFSASNPGGPIHRFITFLQHRHALVTSHYALSEAERNIALKRPQWMECFRQVMKKITLVSDVPLDADVALAEKDRSIPGSAIAARCDRLLTGDRKDFGHLYGKNIKGVTVVDYAMLANALSGENPPPTLDRPDQSG